MAAAAKQQQQRQVSPAPVAAGDPAVDPGIGESSPRPQKSQAAFRTISEVADELDVAQHVLRFWESKFPQVRPLKRGGGRRYYRPEDVELLRQIRSLLYEEGYTIRGAQKLLRGRRTKPTARGAAEGPAPPSAAAAVEAPPSPRRSAGASTAAATVRASAAAAARIVEQAPVGGDRAAAAETLRVELTEIRELLRQARIAS